jgi:hypothetical protein
MKLRFTRETPHQAHGDTLTYRIRRAGDSFEERLYEPGHLRSGSHGTLLEDDSELLVTGSLHRTYAQTRAVAQMFEELGDRYELSEHDGLERIEEAIRLAGGE